jgi:hypothetical protein
LAKSSRLPAGGRHRDRATFAGQATGRATTATALPGGRTNFVVSVAHIDWKTPTKNWVRMAFYRFDSSGNAYQTFWSFTGLTDYGISTLMKACPYNCDFYTVPGFPTRGTKQIQGTYSDVGNTLTVDWGTGGRESWTVDTSLSGLAMITLNSAKTTYVVSYGFGGGSNASWTTGSSAGGIYQRYRAEANSQGVWGLKGETHNWIYGGPMHFNEIASSASPVGFAPKVTPCWGQCVSEDNGGATVYFGTAPAYNRRAMEREVFVDSHMRNGCYQSSNLDAVHPHVIPSLEIIDDNGVFRGWVSVEVSTWKDYHLNPNCLGLARYVSPS